MAKTKNAEDPIEPILEPAAETQPVKKTRPIFKSEAVTPAEALKPDQSDEEAATVEPAQKKKKHGGWVWVGILGMLVITAIGTAIGYKMAIDLRERGELNERLVTATTQFELAIKNEQEGNLDLARRRLEYIL